MDTQTREKFAKILLDGKTLKCTVADAIEVVSNNEQLSKFNCQHGTILEGLNKAATVSSDSKIIVKHFFINNRTTEILYWCFCDINDLLTISGLTNFRDNKFTKIIRINREDQISFLGKDIKSAIDHCNNKNKYVEGMNNNYVNIDHPLADSIFYNIRFNSKEDKVNCLRNTDLSPRPAKNI